MCWLNKTREVLLKGLCCLSLAGIVVLLNSDCSYAQIWPEEKGKHFIIQYQNHYDRQWAKQVLREAERLYSRIASQLGYVRYQDFWTWDQRVKILIYADKATFHKMTGQPEWVKGGAFRDDMLFKTRVIVTYRQEQEFIDGVLPHEISHLMLRDFVGWDKDIPRWFDEGVAQLQEEKKRDIAHRMMRLLVGQGVHLPFEQIHTKDFRSIKSVDLATKFYVQSVSMVDFLIRQYGSQKFGKLCRNMREGKSFTQALKSTYVNIIESLDEFEKKWLSYMKK